MYVDQYLNQLSEKEKVALDIAKRMLGSFCLEKTIGYLDFKKKYTPPEKI
jgi:hypothetical protein